VLQLVSVVCVLIQIYVQGDYKLYERLHKSVGKKVIDTQKSHTHAIVNISSRRFFLHACVKIISTLATRVQPEKAFCVLEFHSTKSVINVQREFNRKFEKDPPAANSIRKWYENLWTCVSSVRGRVEADQLRVRKQLVVSGRQGIQHVGRA
jgi:hypothetical protein